MAGGFRGHFVFARRSPDGAQRNPGRPARLDRRTPTHSPSLLCGQSRDSGCFLIQLRIPFLKFILARRQSKQLTLVLPIKKGRDKVFARLHRRRCGRNVSLHIRRHCDEHFELVTAFCSAAQNIKKLYLRIKNVLLGRSGLFSPANPYCFGQANFRNDKISCLRGQIHEIVLVGGATRKYFVANAAAAVI
jgi:hypothetical protein